MNAKPRRRGAWFAVGAALALAAIVEMAMLGRSVASTQDAAGPAALSNEAVSVVGDSIWFVTPNLTDSYSLTVGDPSGTATTQTFAPGTVPSYSLHDGSGATIADGAYQYELRDIPTLDAETQQTLDDAADSPDREAIVEQLQAEGKLPAQEWTSSGTFSVVQGAFVVPSGTQETTTSTATKTATEGVTPQAVTPEDVVYNDDVIVVGSLAVGIDAVSNENFGFDTIRIKENNTRLQFFDTSNSSGFPTENWQIRANDSSGGGRNFLAFVDQGADGSSETGNIVFRVDAGAPTDALHVAGNGLVGLGTATPVLSLHLVKGDSPGVRMQQPGTLFPPYVWDVAANETNFFVRDVTGGSLLPFRIFPGAPTDSLDVASTGHIGIGTRSPAANLHVLDATGKVEALFQYATLPPGQWTLSFENAKFSLAQGGGGAEAIQIGSTNTANGQWATVSGGSGNNAKASKAVVCGGINNTASDSCVVGGGRTNEAKGLGTSVVGGRSNRSAGNFSFVGGGEQNLGTGDYAAIPGGFQNQAAGFYSFAAGRRAKAVHNGAFVWGDNTDADLTSTAAGQFLVRAHGGVTFYSNAAMTTGVTLAPGSGSFISASDRNLKKNIKPVENQKVLEKLAAVPVSEWSYKSQDDSIRHMGPMAQDLHAAFGLGETDKGINSIDADGIALAAIQGLYKELRETRESLKEKDARIEALETRLAALEKAESGK